MGVASGIARKLLVLGQVHHSEDVDAQGCGGAEISNQNMIKKMKESVTFIFNKRCFSYGTVISYWIQVSDL